MRRNRVPTDNDTVVVDNRVLLTRIECATSTVHAQLTHDIAHKRTIHFMATTKDGNLQCE